MKKILVLADYSWMLHRFNHVFGNLSNNDVFTGVAYGFTNFVSSLTIGYLKKNIHLDIIFCLDTKSKERLELNPAYKSGRPNDSQEKLALKNAQADVYSITCLAKNVSFSHYDGKEADDVLAMLAKIKQPDYDQVVIYSGDKDMYQVKHFGIEISNQIEKSTFLLLSDLDIQIKMDNCKLSNLTEYRALVGDKSDRLEPVFPRIQKKFAIQIAEYIHENQGLVDSTPEAWDKKLKLVYFKVLENKRNFFNNFQVMDLTKYFTCEDDMFQPNIYRTFSDHSYLLDTYGLNKFKEFLEYQKSFL